MNNELGKERGHSRHLANGQFTGSALPSLRGRRRSEISQGEVTNISDGGFCMVATNPCKFLRFFKADFGSLGFPRKSPLSSKFAGHSEWGPGAATESACSMSSKFIALLFSFLNSPVVSMGRRNTF